MSNQHTAKRTEDTFSYLIQDVPGEAWRHFKVRAILEQKTLRDALIDVIVEYGKGEPKPRRK